MTYKLVRKLFGSMISSFEGLPHPTGLALHATLFGIAIYLLMGTHCGKGCNGRSTDGASDMGKKMSKQDTISGANLTD